MASSGPLLQIHVVFNQAQSPPNDLGGKGTGLGPPAHVGQAVVRVLLVFVREDITAQLVYVPVDVSLPGFTMLPQRIGHMPF